MTPPPVGPRLVGPRLELRPIGEEDLPAIAALHREPRVTRLLVDGIPDTVPKARIFLNWNAPYQAQGMGNFAVFRRGEPELAGLYSLVPFANDEAVLEFGGKLHPRHWRGGLALEAARLLIGYALGELGRDQLVSAVHPDNRSAALALTRLGFERAGEDRLFGNPVVLMGLGRERWRPA